MSKCLSHTVSDLYLGWLHIGLCYIASQENSRKLLLSYEVITWRYVVFLHMLIAKMLMVMSQRT